ncbi:RNI-like protein [Anaeromyces robustus]|uniref:RNI-like protein n=1 Tax=Anaeromyces robustus TaxID=1754192 RepID=A0A1Y1WTR9_9FUNG|nr:RNI-like protein [Anaeromyces robustus]|eukprot:ORX76636.1 RNI-like protein [Anaeromyces robustus]
MSVENSEQGENKGYFPEKILKLIFQYLSNEDKYKLLTVCKTWSKPLIESLYQNAVIKSSGSFENFLKVINSNESYRDLVKSLEISGTADIWMGDIENALKPLKKLDTFTISNSPNVTNILLHSIGNHCPQLKNLYLPGCVGLTDAFIPQLCKQCKDLEKIDLSFTNVSVGIIPAALINLRNVRELNLGDSKESTAPVDMGDENFIRPLVTLNLRNSPITDQMLDWVVSRCPDIETVVLENCQNVTDHSIVKLANKLKGLTTLDISFCDQITDASLNALAENEDSKLKFLDLSYCYNITTRGIKQVGLKCTRLESLVLNGVENILNTCQQYCDGDECVLEGESIKRLVDGLEATTLEDKPAPNPEDLIVPIRKIAKDPTEAELASQSKEKKSKGVVTEDLNITQVSLKMKKSQEPKSEYSEDDDDSLPSLNSGSQVSNEVGSNTNNNSTNNKPRRSNSYYKKGPRSDNSNRNSGKYSRGSKRSSYYNKNKDSDSLHSDVNDRPKPRRRQSFNSNKSNQYQDQNGNTHYKRRSYIKSNNSHYSNNSNRYNKNNNENYQREGSYNKGKGELLGKIKFMLKDGPRYISIHENDDPQDLGYNFCKYYNMMDIMEGVVKTIAIKKNAMRKKKIYV